jgi:hypothetical protein
LAGILDPWYDKLIKVDNKKWNRPLTSTAISRYVDNYQALSGKNPFKIAISSFKMK